MLKAEGMYVRSLHVHVSALLSDISKIISMNCYFKETQIGFHHKFYIMSNNNLKRNNSLFYILLYFIHRTTRIETHAREHHQQDDQPTLVPTI